MTYAFINNTLSSNFDRYLSEILSEANVVHSKTSYKPQDAPKPSYRKGKKFNLQVIEEMIQDEDLESSSLVQDGLLTDYDDLRLTIGNLYPERQTTSRFSIHNPHARFTRNHDELRQTIREFREIGKSPSNGASLSKVPGSQSFIPGYNGPVFQKQGVLSGHGGPSSSLFACENLMN